MTNVSLDTSEVRPARQVAAATPPRAAGTRPSRLLVAGGAGLGLAILTGAGFGAYTVLVPAPVSKSAAAPAARGKIQFGPLADMPEIRDGVPALARSVPANLIERRVVEIPPAPVAAPPQVSERDVAAAPARRSGQPGPDAEAVNARAPAPSVPGPREASAPARIVATQPVPSAPDATPAPVVASLESAASPVAAEAPPAALRRDPEPAASGQPASAPARPVAVPAQPPRQASTETPPLPPVRRVSRAFEAPVQAQPAPRQAAIAQRPVAAPAGAPAAPVVARAVPEAEERPEIFGLPLPRFVPTGRQIRDAASSVADAVTSIPDVF